MNLPSTTSSLEIQRFLTQALGHIYSPQEANSLAFRLMEHDLGLSKINIMADQPIPTTSLDTLAEHLTQLLAQVPLQYVLGKAHFCGLDLVVSPEVLIPRPETEELVHRIVAEYPITQGLKILDIGTGSGCIAISLAHLMPRSQVTGVDVSPSALALAKTNAARNGVLVDFQQMDILATDELPHYDIVVSNPPYVLPSDQPNMHPNVLNHEPHLALFVDESTPTRFHQHIAKLASVLHPCSLYMEINERLGLETLQAIWEYFPQESELITDIHGKDRFVKAVF